MSHVITRDFMALELLEWKNVCLIPDSYFIHSYLSLAD